MIAIWTKPFELFTKSEKDELNGEDLTDKIDLVSTDLSPLNRKFKEFWEQEAKLIEFSLMKKKLNKSKKFCSEAFDSTRWTISVDVISTGIVTGIFDGIEEGIEHFNQYWEEFDLRTEASASITSKILGEFIEKEMRLINEVNQRAGHVVIPPEVEPLKIKNLMNKASSEGLLDCYPSPQLTAEYMGELGWRLGKNGEGKTVWMPIVM